MKKLMMLTCTAFLFALSVNAQTIKADVAKTPSPPPPPPPPPKVEVVKFTPPKVVKDNMLTISIINGDTIISATKNNVTQKIKMKDWIAKKEYYEHKYGQLPLSY